MVWGTYRLRKHTALQSGKNGPNKSAPECPDECGGGAQSLFGQCPNGGGVNVKGSSLSSTADVFGCVLQDKCLICSCADVIGCVLVAVHASSFQVCFSAQLIPAEVCVNVFGFKALHHPRIVTSALHFASSTCFTSIHSFNLMTRR